MTLYRRAPSGTLYPFRSTLGPRDWPIVEIDDTAIVERKPPKFKVGDRIRLKVKPDHRGVVAAVDDYLYMIDWPLFSGARYGHSMIDRDYELAPPEPKFKEGDRIRSKTNPLHRGVVREVRLAHYKIEWDSLFQQSWRPADREPIDRDYELVPTVEQILDKHLFLPAEVKHVARVLREAFPELP